MANKYRSNDKLLNSAISVFMNSHSRTINNTMFNNVETIFTAVKIPNLREKMADFKRYVKETVLVASAVSPNSLYVFTEGSDARISSPALNVKSVFEKYTTISSKKRRITSKLMKENFKESRVILKNLEHSREKTEEMFVRYNKHLKKWNQINELDDKKALSELKISVVPNAVSNYSYHNFTTKKYSSNVKKTLDTNKKELMNIFEPKIEEKEKDELLRIIDLYGVWLRDFEGKTFENFLQDTCDGDVDIFMNKYKIPSKHRLIFKSRNDVKIDKIKLYYKTIIKLLNTSTEIYFYHMHDDVQNNTVWYHELIDERALDRAYSLSRPSSESERSDALYGLNILFNYADGQQISNSVPYKPTGNETGPVESDVTYRNQNLCELNIMSKMLGLSSVQQTQDKYKQDLIRICISRICGNKVSNLSEILVLFWSLNYEHVTLYIHGCRGGSQDNRDYKLETSSTPNNNYVRPNSTELRRIEEHYEKRINDYKKTKKSKKSKSSKRSTKLRNKTSSSEGWITSKNATIKRKSVTKWQPITQRKMSSSSKGFTRTKESKRCPNGQKRNKDTGNCEPKIKKWKVVQNRDKTSSSKRSRSITSTGTKKHKRCPNGQRRNKSTGNCETKLKN